MEEQLISLETAKLAKEKGFPQYKDLSIDEIDKMNLGSWGICNKWDKPEWKLNWYGEAATETITAPTQSLLQKWLREIHNLHIMIESYSIGDNRNIEYVGIVVNDKFTHEDPKEEDYKVTYEEALEAGLLEALELI